MKKVIPSHLSSGRGCSQRCESGNKGAEIMADGSVEFFDKIEIYIIRVNETESKLVVKLAMASGG